MLRYYVLFFVFFLTATPATHTMLSTSDDIVIGSETAETLLMQDQYGFTRLMHAIAFRDTKKALCLLDAAEALSHP